jgi:16S rRNA (cytosine967-C5)-methyltransferase
LLAVEQGKKAADAVESASRRHHLGREDRRLLTQLTYGVLRHRRLLDWWMAPGLRHPVGPAVRNILRLAFFQAAFLERVPPYAVVSSAVEQAKRVEPAAQRLVNAVLRQRLHQRPWPEDPAIRYSLPDWLLARWRRRWPEAWEDVARASNEVPPLTLRVGPDIERGQVVHDLLEAGIPAEASTVVPDAVRVAGAVWLEDWPWFRRGQVTVQDESSQLVAWVLDPRPGEELLDLAAGLGGKTLHLLDRAPTARVVAVDTSEARLQALGEAAARRGVGEALTLWAGDGRTLPADWGNRFDRALVDAPCSNLGVLRRRADARWLKGPEDLPRLVATQRDLLIEAARVVRPGGVVVYSVCSTEPEETEGVLAAVQETIRELEAESPAPWLPDARLRALAGPGGLMIPPGYLGMDGFFIARWRKQAREGK